MELYTDTAVLPQTARQFAQGTAVRAYEVFGCHHAGDQGFVFRVWAPAAAAVSLVGDLNAWDPTALPMERLEDGVWECACQNLQAYTPYKYHIITQDGQAVERADPFAVVQEPAPGTASLVYAPEGYAWQDEAWMARRQTGPVCGGPLNIYQVDAGSWRRFTHGGPLTGAALTEELVPYVKELGYTHILLQAGPLTGPALFAPDCCGATPAGLRALVDACHQANIGVLLSWNGAFFSPSPAGLGRFDGSACYDRSEEDEGCFDYEKPAAVSLLLSSAVYWMEEYHLDGLVVEDTVAMLYLDHDRPDGRWQPNDRGGRERLAGVAFLRRLTATLREICPGVLLIARDGAAWPQITHPVSEQHGLGFTHTLDGCWAADMGWYMALEPARRREQPDLLTNSMLHAFDERYVLPIAPETWVGHMPGSLAGDYEQQLAGLRVMLGYQMVRPGAKLHFMGTEFGQMKAWDPQGELDWLLLDYEEHRMMRHYTRTLNRLYRDTPALWEADGWDGFRWLSDREAADGVLAFCRMDSRGRPVVAVCHFLPVWREPYAVGLPVAGEWVELFNSDLAEFGGENVCNRTLTAEPIPLHGMAQSVRLLLPPLSMVVLRPKDV